MKIINILILLAIVALTSCSCTPVANGADLNMSGYSINEVSNMTLRAKYTSGLYPKIIFVETNPVYNMNASIGLATNKYGHDGLVMKVGTDIRFYADENTVVLGDVTRGIQVDRISGLINILGSWNLNLCTNRIINVAWPTANNDAVPKMFTDNLTNMMNIGINGATNAIVVYVNDTSNSIMTYVDAGFLGTNDYARTTYVDAGLARTADFSQISYVDAGMEYTNNYVLKSGDTMSGPLNISLPQNLLYVVDSGWYAYGDDINPSVFWPYSQGYTNIDNPNYMFISNGSQWAYSINGGGPTPAATNSSSSINSSAYIDVSDGSTPIFDEGDIKFGFADLQLNNVIFPLNNLSSSIIYSAITSFLDGVGTNGILFCQGRSVFFDENGYSKVAGGFPQETNDFTTISYVDTIFSNTFNVIGASLDAVSLDINYTQMIVIDMTNRVPYDFWLDIKGVQIVGFSNVYKFMPIETNCFRVYPKSTRSGVYVYSAINAESNPVEYYIGTCYDLYTNAFLWVQ